MQKIAIVPEFNTICNVFKKFTEDIQFKFDSSGLHVKNMTRNGYMMILLDHELDVESHCEFYVEMGTLSKIEEVDVEVLKDENYVEFVRGRTKVKIRPIDPRNVTPRGAPKVTWDYNSVMLDIDDMKELQKLLKDEKDIYFEIRNGDFIIQSGTDVQVTYTKEGVTGSDINCKTKMSCDLIQEGTNAFKSFSTFELCLGHDMPMVFKISKEHMKYDLFIAQRIEAD